MSLFHQRTRSRVQMYKGFGAVDGPFQPRAAIRAGAPQRLAA